MGTITEINRDRGFALERAISFPWGLPGLEDHREFILSPLEQGSPFYYLGSRGQPEIGLLLVDPFAVCKNYEFDLDEEAAGRLHISDPQQAAVLCTVNTSRGVGAATVNLLAPLVINLERLLAKQVVLRDRRYSYRAPLPLERAGAAGAR